MGTWQASVLVNFKFAILKRWPCKSNPVRLRSYDTSALKVEGLRTSQEKACDAART